LKITTNHASLTPNVDNVLRSLTGHIRWLLRSQDDTCIYVL